MREGLEKEGDVAFAYLFGSVVKGRTREASDLDVGVHLPEGWTPSRRLERALSIEKTLEERTTHPVQLTVLNDAPLELRANILQTGLPLHVRDGAARRAFFVDTGRRYYDMAPAREIFRRYQARRIRKGTFGG